MITGGMHISIWRFNDDVGSIFSVHFDTRHQTALSREDMPIEDVQVQNSLRPRALLDNDKSIALTFSSVDDKFLVLMINCEGTNQLKNPPSHFRMAHIPSGRLANSMVSATEVLFLPDLAWVFAKHSELEITKLVSDLLDDANCNTQILNNQNTAVWLFLFQ